MDHVQQQSRDAEQRTALAYCAGCAALLITLVCVAARTGDVVVDQGPPRPDVILVTGFRDFNGEENPSAVAATRLNGTGSITSVVLPVDEAELHRRGLSASLLVYKDKHFLKLKTAEMEGRLAV